jgi:ApaG protein
MPAPIDSPQLPLPTIMSNAELLVEVACQHVPNTHGDAEDYVFQYTITIRNVGEVAAQVIARTWHINDANGFHEKVRGLGVVGHQPLIQPGESFQYTSGTRLRTATGTMHGRYLCVTTDGDPFEVDIPMFVLDGLSDHSSRPLH